MWFWLQKQMGLFKGRYTRQESWFHLAKGFVSERDKNIPRVVSKTCHLLSCAETTVGLL